MEEAILLAGCGKWKRLREALEDPDQAEEVLQICRLLDEEPGMIWQFPLGHHQHISKSVEQKVIYVLNEGNCF